MFPVYGGKCFLPKAVHNWVEKISRTFESGRDNSQKTSMLRFSTQHWQSDGTSVSMLVEHMPRNKCIFQVRISHVLRFKTIFDLFNDSPSYDSGVLLEGLKKS
jgi:hypothetical protein